MPEGGPHENSPRGCRLKLLEGSEGPGGPRGLLPWGSGKEVTSPPVPPGSRGALLLPSPPERHVNLSVYAAQASLKVSRGTRWGAGASPARYWSGADERYTPETAPAVKLPSHLLCLPSQLLRRSRTQTPEGSQPAFAEGGRLGVRPI